MDDGFEKVPVQLSLPRALLLDVFERRAIPTGQVKPDQVGSYFHVLGEGVD